MSTETATGPSRGLTPERIRATEPYVHVLVPRLVASGALLMTGLSHVFVPEAPLLPLVEAAGFPLATVAAPVFLALKLVVGVALALGLWARVAGLFAVPMMLAALYAHLVIDVWPNPEMGEPPLALPIAVLVSGAYVAWRGAGRWSLDRRRSADAP